MDKLDVLHTLIQVARGKVAHLAQDVWDEMEETIKPGSTAVSLNEQEKSQLATLQARQDAITAAQAPAPAPAAAPAPEPAPAAPVFTPAPADSDDDL